MNERPSYRALRVRDQHLILDSITFAHCPWEPLHNLTMKNSKRQPRTGRALCQLDLAKAKDIASIKEVNNATECTP